LGRNLSHCRWSADLWALAVRVGYDVVFPFIIAVTADTKCAAVLRGDAGGATSAGWSSGRGERHENVDDVELPVGGAAWTRHVRGSVVARA
jgi:hypothetical protein